MEVFRYGSVLSPFRIHPEYRLISDKPPDDVPSPPEAQLLPGQNPDHEFGNRLDIRYKFSPHFYLSAQMPRGKGFPFPYSYSSG